MLAFMPQSLPVSKHHTPTPLPSNTMSVAILPSSPLVYSQTVPALYTTAPVPSKRPKLTVDTAGTSSVFGKASTSLRLETLSATSPTLRNTFKNGYNTAQSLRGPTPKAERPSLTPITIIVPPDTTRKPMPLRPYFTSSADSADLTSSAVSATPISIVDSVSREVPYKLAYDLTSILTNGPLPRTRNRAHCRAMSPPEKKVAFRAPLTEDIKTSKYTMAHSDIDSSASSISTLELPEPQYRFGKSQSGMVKQGDTAEAEGDAQAGASAAPRTGDKRESSDEEDSDTCPSTPVAGRRKRHRQWCWTLGPIENAQQKPAAAEEVDKGKPEPSDDKARDS